jgi:hypothetical protein
MCQRLHRAGASKISPKNGGSTPTFSLSIGDVCWQTNAIGHIGKPEFVSTRVIQVRLSRNSRWQKQGGWVVFEDEGVSPVFCGEDGRESALSYARQRAGYGRAEIQVLDERWNVVETITNEDLKPVV